MQLKIFCSAIVYVDSHKRIEVQIHKRSLHQKYAVPINRHEVEQMWNLCFFLYLLVCYVDVVVCSADTAAAVAFAVVWCVCNETKTSFTLFESFVVLGDKKKSFGGTLKKEFWKSRSTETFSRLLTCQDREIYDNKENFHWIESHREESNWI